MKASDPIVTLAALLALAACATPFAAAHRTAGRHPVSKPVNLDVQPTPEIEAHVAVEVAKAKGILDGLNADNVLASPYLVSAIYYHDNFLSDFSVDRNNADPERRIIGQISNMLSPERKARFVGLLHGIWSRSEPMGPERWAEPVFYKAWGGGRRTHQYAIDLFAPEGAAVYAVARGMVILADRDWSADNLFSTTSRKGGNAVIVFDPDHDRFYRYCHLSTVQVFAGKIVTPGEILGSVGHTGLGASQPGHGGHLHFETNEYREGHVKAMDYRHLRTMLRQWRAAADIKSTGKIAEGGTKTSSPRVVSKR